MAPSSPPIAADVLAWLRHRGSRRNVEGMARFAIHSEKAFGVSMATMKPLASRLRPNHDLALQLWESGWHEARMLATLIDDPARVTVTQMNAWARDFDNWAVCDTACFHLFDRTPLVWKVLARWAASPREFVKRAAFALVASLALHDRDTSDDAFVALLPTIERAAADDRNFVKKGVNWALRSVGERSPFTHTAALTLARRLASSAAPAPRWVGQDALRDLKRPLVLARIDRRDQAKKARAARTASKRPKQRR
ncbi:MAG: DNA alkylation repair protein [Acidobacteriota bacterium]